MPANSRWDLIRDLKGFNSVAFEYLFPMGRYCNILSHFSFNYYNGFTLMNFPSEFTNL